MAVLYVENIPDDLYEALRGRARAREAPLHRRGGPGPARRKCPHTTRIESPARLAPETCAPALEAPRFPPYVSHKRRNAAPGPRAVSLLVVDANVAAKWLLRPRGGGSKLR